MTNLPEVVKGNLPEIPAGDKCNARNKAKTKYCQNVAGYKTDHVGVGRCAFHGGASKRGVHHPAFKHGKYSMVLPDQLIEHYEQIVSDGDLLELREDVVLMTTLIRDTLKEMKEN